jgi:hypothetical protein
MEEKRDQEGKTRTCRPSLDVWFEAYSYVRVGENDNQFESEVQADVKKVKRTHRASRTCSERSCNALRGC